MTERIANITRAVEKAAGCPATHIDSGHVVEGMGDVRVWEGIVEVFELQDHPQAKRAFAWQYFDNDEPQYTVVLETGPVDSPNAAVRAAIVSSQQK